MSKILPQESAPSRRKAPAASFANVLPEFRRFRRFHPQRTLRLLRPWQFFLMVLALLALPGSAGAQASFGSQAVGASTTQTVTVTAQAAGTVSTVEVLTAGAPGLDFTAASGGSCSGAGLAIGGQCTQPVTFTPAYPGPRTGAVVLLTSSNQVIGTALLSGTGSGGLGVLVPSAVQSAAVAQALQQNQSPQYPFAGTAQTLAGNGQWQDANVGDGGTATKAELFLPAAVAVDGFGNIYIADSNHQRVRLVCAGNKATIAGTSCPGTGIISTVADATDGLNTPSGVAIDGAGNLYIADTGNHVVREISAVTGTMTTIAGTGTAGRTGDNGPATSAELGSPFSLALDGQGDLFIADNSESVIRAVCAAPGTLFGVSCAAAGDIVTVAGTGSAGNVGDGGPAIAAQLDSPYALAIGPRGNLYIADTQNNRVRAVCASSSQKIFGTSCTLVGMIFTVVGDGTGAFSGDGGAASKAQVNSPSGLALDPAGDLYIADTQNNRIRKINASTGIIITLEGVGTPSYVGDGGPALEAGIHGPYGLAFYNAAPTGGSPLAHLGDLLVADYFNQRIRSVQSNLTVLSFPTPIRQGYTSQAPTKAADPSLVTVENDGNDTLDLTTLTADADFAIGTQAVAGVNLCADGESLTTSSQCTVEPIFAPAGSPPLGAASQQETGNIDVNNDTVTSIAAANSPLTLSMTGTATLVNPTTVTVTSSPNPSNFGQSITFNATVVITSGSGTPGGTVTFFDGKTQLGSASVSSGGVATFKNSTLTVGTHQITANYSGDTNDQPSTSQAYIQTVDEETATALASSANPSALNTAVTFTATVTVPNGGGVTPDGTVTFLDGTTTLATVPLPANGIAQFSTASLTQGTHSITAVYSGDAANFIAGSSSAALSQVVLAGSTVIVDSSLNPSTYGTGVTFTATVTSAGTITATGSVTFLDGATKIGTGTLNGSGVATAIVSNLAVGSHSITASYGGDSNVGPGSSQPITQVVNPAQTSTTLIAAPTPGIAGKPVALTATVAVTGGGSATVSGKVTFSNGTTNLGTASVGSGGTASISPILAPGSYSIVATYSGDSNDNASVSAALPLTVVQTTTQVALTSSSPSAVVLSAVVFKAVVTGNGATPGGSIVFSVDGASAGTATLDSTGSATFTDSALAVGTHSVVATYTGDTNDAGSASSALSQVITAIPTITDLGASSTSGATPTTILVATTIASTGPIPTGTITFNNGTTVIGTATLDSSGVATLVPNLPTGNYNIVASYGGDSIHSPSQSSPVSINGAPAGFSISVAPPTLTLVSGQNGTLSVTLSSNAGFADSIGMGCLSVPVAVNCHFSTNTVNLTSGQSQTVQLTIDTNAPLSGGSSASIARPRTRDVSLAGLFLPASLFFGFVFWRFRRRHAAVLVAALALFLAGAIAVTGCTASFSQVTAAPGTYTIQVGGIGANSNTSHYQNVTLTITK